MEENKKVNKRAVKKQTKSKEKINNNSNKKDTLFIDYLKFYKENLRKNHLIIYILLLIVFFITIIININSIQISQEISDNLNNITSQANNVNIFKLIVTEKIPLTFLVIFAGITPYFYLSILGFIYPYLQALDMIEAFYAMDKVSNLILMSIGCIIEFIGFGLAIVNGFYYCKLSSKRFRYNQSKSYSFNDVKKNFYSATRKEEKLKELTKKMEDKAKEKEKLNVKIPYNMLFISFVISTVIVVIGSLIARI